MTGRDKAVELLTHYLRLPWEHAGLGWDHENAAEVGQIVDELMRAVRDEVREHVENAPHIYADGSTS